MVDDDILVTVAAWFTSKAPIRPNPSRGGGGKPRIFPPKMAGLPEDERFFAGPGFFARDKNGRPGREEMKHPWPYLFRMFPEKSRTRVTAQPSTSWRNSPAACPTTPRAGTPFPPAPPAATASTRTTAASTPRRSRGAPETGRDTGGMCRAERRRPVPLFPRHGPECYFFRTGRVYVEIYRSVR